MTIVNYDTKEINCKIVYYGPPLSGKTRNLKTIFERTPSTNRGELICLQHDDERTCYFDFLPLFLGQLRGFTTRLHLYTVPGNAVFDSNRRMILKGVDGIVFVADSRRERLDENLESMDNLRKNLAAHGYDLERIPMVVQYNMRDFPTAMCVDDLAVVLNPSNRPQFTANAQTGDGATETLKAVSRLVLKDLIREK